MSAVRYAAVLRKDPKSDYGVDFPDFPGCVSAGSTMDEALHMAEEALELHVAGMRTEGLEIPEPTPAEDVMERPENRGATCFLVSVDTAAPRKVRVNVTFNEDVLRRIDAYAERRHMTRSAFLADAALKRIYSSD